MSDEYIKRGDAIIEIASMGAIHGSEGAWIHQADVLGRLRTLPSTDVVERKRGKWLSDKRQHFCSECRKKAKSIVVDIKLVDNYYCHKSEPITEYKFGEFLSDFCPNCGAKMDGEREDE